MSMPPKTVSIPHVTHQLAEKVAKENNMKIGEYSTAAIQYFAERGLNPKVEMTRPTEVIVAEIRKLGNRLFGFLQEQERGLLAPLLEEMIRSRAIGEEALDFSLQSMVKLYSDEHLLEMGRERSRERVEKKVSTALGAASESAPGKKGK